jgi:hypothetical protein
MKADALAYVSLVTLVIQNSMLGLSLFPIVSLSLSLSLSLFIDLVTYIVETK